MSENTILYLAIYYFLFWVLNVIAYLIATLGFRQWLPFVIGTSLYKICELRSYITLTAGVVRFMSGLVAIVLYKFYGIELVAAIFILGVVSLFLNTLFIFVESLSINKQARQMTEMSVENAELMKQAIRQMDNLKLTIERKARLPKINGRPV